MRNMNDMAEQEKWQWQEPGWAWKGVGLCDHGAGSPDHSIVIASHKASAAFVLKTYTKYR
jgi:hypothetical protein